MGFKTSFNRRDLLARAGYLSIASQMGFELQAAPPASLTLPVKNDFPVAKTQSHLNNARWHPMSIQAMAAVQQYLEFKAQTPIGIESTAGKQADVKSMFAKLIHAQPSEISFVQSTMAGENLIVAGLGIPGGGGNVVTDALHFEGSTYLYRSLQRQGLDLRVVMPKDWRIELRELEKVIDGKTKLVALSAVSFANGFQHDLKAVCDLAHSHGAYVYADIVQAAGAIPIDVRASGVDFCACASYKWLMGDMGLGFLYARGDLLGKVVHRVQYGYRQIENFENHMFPYDPPAAEPATWSQGSGAASYFEVGTLSSATVACLAHSLKYIEQLGVENIQAHAQSLTRRIQKELPRLGFQPLTPPESTSPIVTFAVKDPAAVDARLKKAQVAVKVAEHAMRISPSVYNDQHDIDNLLNALS
jgi:selenocysteine lyase/cysteine desulfurase